ncbi:MAG: helix-turn-helix transcriptional regulator [Bacteroides sp.]|nr:helix-turn-helix transcriptional regulator [Bacteroides sp.]
MSRIFSHKKLCSGKCPLRIVMDRFGDKWSVLILLTLHENGVMRFNELSGCIEDISLKVLSSTLKILEEEQFVKRTIYPEVPPRVEYELTQIGEEMIPFIKEIADWARKTLL